MTNRNVTRWADELEAEALERGLDPDLWVPAGLAEIAVESAGNPKAHRPGSQFWSLLQFGRLAGIDAGLPDRGRNTSKPLHGDGERAIALWVKVVLRYKARVFYGDERVPPHVGIAILWKGGAGTARRVKDYLAKHQDRSLEQALKWIEKHPNPRCRIPNMLLYVQRIQKQHPIYKRWYKNEHKPAHTTHPDGLNDIAGLLGRILGAFA